MGPREDAEPEPVSVLVGCRTHDGLRRLPQPGVDDVHAGIAQGAGHDLDATVMAVQADLCQHDADGNGHGHDYISRALGHLRAFIISGYEQTAEPLIKWSQRRGTW